MPPPLGLHTLHTVYHSAPRLITNSTAHHCVINDRVAWPSLDEFTKWYAHIYKALCNLIIPWTYLIVHLQWVSFSFGLEVLCVGVHCEVNLLVEALYMNRVPVLVIQQTAHSDCNTTAAEPQPAVIWRNTKTAGTQQEHSEQLYIFHSEPANVWGQTRTAQKTHIHTQNDVLSIYSDDVY